MARFLFATMAIVGHVAPIAPVARELITRGHEVTWYTSKHFEDKITATGATLLRSSHRSISATATTTSTSLGETGTRACAKSSSTSSTSLSAP